MPLASLPKQSWSEAISSVGLCSPQMTGATQNTLQAHPTIWLPAAQPWGLPEGA